MSISAAVAELNKEISVLDKTIVEAEKTKARLVGHRDALLKEDQSSGSSVVTKGKPGRKPGRPAKTATTVKKATPLKKAVGPQKAIAAKKTVVAKKRTVSPEGKKRMAEAQKKRWAAKKATVKAE